MALHHLGLDVDVTDVQDAQTVLFTIERMLGLIERGLSRHHPAVYRNVTLPVWEAVERKVRNIAEWVFEINRIHEGNIVIMPRIMHLSGILERVAVLVDQGRFVIDATRALRRML